MKSYLMLKTSGLINVIFYSTSKIINGYYFHNCYVKQNTLCARDRWIAYVQATSPSGWIHITLKFQFTITYCYLEETQDPHQRVQYIVTGLARLLPLLFQRAAATIINVPILAK
jgi:hypothetical protein